jgi:hypothetical protein
VSGTGPKSGVALAVAVLLSACGPAADQPTLEPAPSVAQEDREQTDAAVAKFVELMADPELTFRVNGEVRAGSVDGDGRPDVWYWSHYDVHRDDYAGGVSIHLRDPTVGGDHQVRVLDDEVITFDWTGTEWSADDAPDSLRRPTAIRSLAAEDLVPFGVTDDGLVELRVTRWLHGDPISEWRTIGIVPERGLPEHTHVEWHDTRLFLDAGGVPQRLSTSWTFSQDGEDELVSGTIVDEFVGFGMYVTGFEPDGFPFETSHNVNGRPFVELIPDGETATLDVAFVEPDQPVMLGIEGAIFFLRSHDGGGDITLDRIVQHPEHRLEVPVGAQTLVAYYRTCNANCGNLDPPHDFCSIETELEAGRTYRLAVQVKGPALATCDLSDPR